MIKTRQEKSDRLWEAARGFKFANGSEIRCIASLVGLAKPTVQSILNMGDKHNSYEFVTVARNLVGDEWMSWEGHNSFPYESSEPFEVTINKPVPKEKRKLQQVHDFTEITPNQKPPKPTNEKKALDARDQFCVNHPYREAMNAHPTGFGSTMGGKDDSLFCSWLCDECHKDRDQYRNYKGVMTEMQRLQKMEKETIEMRKTQLEKKAQGRIKEI